MPLDNERLVPQLSLKEARALTRIWDAAETAKQAVSRRNDARREALHKGYQASLKALEGRRRADQDKVDARMRAQQDEVYEAIMAEEERSGKQRPRVPLDMVAIMAEGRSRKRERRGTGKGEQER